MKTPKRESNLSMFDLFAEPEKAEVKCARWKRKNKIAQYKRTIARLTRELQYEREYSRCFLDAYNRLARTVRNAKQNTLLCTDAEQSTERKDGK